MLTRVTQSMQTCVVAVYYHLNFLLCFSVQEVTFFDHCQYECMCLLSEVFLCFVESGSVIDCCLSECLLDFVLEYMRSLVV